MTEIQSPQPAPAVSLKGLTFLPVPEFPNGANLRDYFNRYNLPDVPSKFVAEVSRMFFEGGKWPEFGDDVDETKARRALHALLGSWAPAHEAKEATVAYALWVWSPEAAAARAAATAGAAA